MTKRLFQIHSWIGLIGAIALVLIGLTGSVLVFHEELDRWLNPSLLTVEPGRQRLSLDTLLARAQAAWPEYQINGINLVTQDNPRAALTFWLYRNETYVQGHLNPYTGAALGLREDTLMLWLLELHKSFLANDWGMTAVFLFGVGLIASCLTGIFISRDFRRVLRQPRIWGPSARLVLSDWHKLVGISALLFNLLLGFTGAWMNWEAVLRAVGGKKKAAETTTFLPISIPASRIVESAQKALPGLRVTFVNMPSGTDSLVTVYGTVPRAWLFGPYGCRVLVDSRSGTVRELVDIRRGTAKEKFDALIAPLHFGNFGGIGIKVLWCLAGLTPAFLAVTGLLIRWRRRRRSSSTPLASSVNVTG